jgi:hypothetical protein
MYDLGAQDAERDDLNPFYYQHYFYYRKGYDEARRQLRRSPVAGVPVQRSPLLFGLIGVVVLTAAVLWVLFGRTDTNVATPDAAPTAAPTTPTARPTPMPTAVPVILAPEPEAEPVIAVGGRARVANLSGAPLRARDEPGLSTRIVARIPEGSEVDVLDGPVELEGYTWWQISSPDGTGWSAERSPDGVVFLEPVP